MMLSRGSDCVRGCDLIYIWVLWNAQKVGVRLLDLTCTAALATRTTLWASQGKLDEADPLYLRSIEIQEKTLGPDHPELAFSLNNRAGLLQAQVR